MKESNIKSMNNVDLDQNKEVKNNLENILSKQIILVEIFQFMKAADIKRLSLCS